MPRHGSASGMGLTSETRVGQIIAFTVSTGGNTFGMTWGTDVAPAKKTP